MFWAKCFQVRSETLHMLQKILENSLILLLQLMIIFWSFKKKNSPLNLLCKTARAYLKENPQINTWTSQSLQCFSKGDGRNRPTLFYEISHATRDWDLISLYNHNFPLFTVIS